MSNEYDGFGDVIGMEQGVLGGGGLSAHDAVKTTPSRDGAVFEFYCERCGKHLRLTVPWVEIIALNYGISPHALAMANHPIASKYRLNQLVNERWEWDAKENGWRPQNAPCTCGNVNSGGWRLIVAQHEPDLILKQARARRVIDPTVEQELSQLASGLARQLAARR